MFTLEQVTNAHTKLKSGKDFPTYIQELKKLGVLAYTCYVHDGSIIYTGADDIEIIDKPKYPSLTIAKNIQSNHFLEQLKAHQRGEIDFLTFVAMCAATGIEFWKLDLSKMTCI